MIIVNNNGVSQVLESSLQQLDMWESLVERKMLSKKVFLTAETAEGLRVTLLSTLGLIKDLTRMHGFKEVYTGYINQDPVEVCQYRLLYYFSSFFFTFANF